MSRTISCSHRSPSASTDQRCPKVRRRGSSLVGLLGAAAPPTEIGGYSILEASSVDEASRVRESHPFVAPGGTLQVNELVGL